MLLPAGVDRSVFAWQHRSPSGLAVLHLELELKKEFREQAVRLVLEQQVTIPENRNMFYLFVREKSIPIHE